MYLVVNQILKVSNLSLYHCGRDAIEFFSEVGSLDLTWRPDLGWPGPKIFRKVAEQLFEQLFKKRRRYLSDKSPCTQLIDGSGSSYLQLPTKQLLKRLRATVKFHWSSKAVASPSPVSRPMKMDNSWHILPSVGDSPPRASSNMLIACPSSAAGKASDFCAHR